MLRNLTICVMAILLLAFSAPASRAEGRDVICSNVAALNSQFVFLMARHLGFEPNVTINPSPEEIVTQDEVRTVRIVVSDKDYNAVLACAARLEVERDELDQRIQELREQLGRPGQPIFPQGPRGKILSTGSMFQLNGRQVFVSISNEEDLMASAAAVAQSHDLDSQSCWFDSACLSAAESYWSMTAN